MSLSNGIDLCASAVHFVVVFVTFLLCFIVFCCVMLSGVRSQFLWQLNNCIVELL